MWYHNKSPITYTLRQTNWSSQSSLPSAAQWTAPGDETFDTNDSGEATVLATDREDVDSDEFQEENFIDSDEVDADFKGKCCVAVIYIGIHMLSIN